MVSHIDNGLLDYIPVSRIFNFPKLVDVSERSQQMPETHADILQIFDTISHIEILVYFFENSQAVFDPVIGYRRNITDTKIHRRKYTGLLAAKMQPIDTPGIGIIRSIFMRHSSRNDEKLIRSQMKRTIVSLDPAFTIDTINQYIFGCPSPPFTIVHRSFGIISDIRKIKRICNRIFYQYPPDTFRNNY